MDIKKRRVLVTFTTDYYPSNTGFAQAFFHLHRSILDNNKCDYVCVFTESNCESPDPKRIEVNSYTRIKGLGLLTNKIAEPIIKLIIIQKLSYVFDRIKELEKNNTIQLILLESMFVAWLAPILKEKFSSIPIVCRIHGTGPEYTAFYREMKETKFREYLLDCVFRLNNIAATTKYYFDFFRDYYRDYGKFMDKDFFILPNTTLPPTRLESTKEQSKIYLLQLGRLDKRGYHQKGFQDTVKALLYIETRYPELAKQIVYKTVGCGDREDEFIKRTRSLHCIEHIHFSRLQNDEVKSLEMESDLVLVPSRCEGMSMFALEAIAAGKPLVCTKGNGLESIGSDGVNALYISEYDYVRMAECIVQLINKKDTLEMYSNNSKEYFIKNCSYSVVADKYEVMVRYLRR